MKQGATRVDRKDCTPRLFLCDLHCPRNRCSGTSSSFTRSRTECDSALQVQAAPKHAASSLRATNSEQRVEIVDTSQRDLTD